MAQLSNNHYRKPNFFGKIEQLLNILKDSIQKYFNQDLNGSFFFRKNKRILLFLFEERLLILDLQFIKLFCTNEYRRYQYISYFTPEIIPLITSGKKRKNPSLKISSSTDQSIMPLSSIQALKEELIKNLPQNFYQNRKIGENDTELCRLIREDSLELFINYISQNAIPLNYCIVPSFYETHRKIGDLTKRVNLIRYALFFGSTRIICFIQSNYCDQFFDLFNFAVYCNIIDVIKLVENTHFRPNTNTESMFKEAIGCHHNDIACYSMLLHGPTTKFTYF